MNDLDFLKRFDSEYAEEMSSRRGALRKAGKLGLGLALATVPGAFGAFTRTAHAQDTPSVTEVLNFALTLEYLERAFYNMGVSSGVIPSGTETSLYTELRNNERAHVSLLEGALGDDAVDEPDFDFTAGGTFDPFSSYDDFLVLSQGFEDTGVRAYKGGAPALMGSDVLTTALRIHSVEARHASVVRRLLDMEGVTPQDGWIEGAGANAPDPIAAVYDGEGDTIVADTDVSGVGGYSSELITESFDEPLGMTAVLNIADPFIAGDQGDPN